MSLRARDKGEQAQKTLYDAYTRLADRAAFAHAQANENMKPAGVIEEPATVPSIKGITPKASVGTASNMETFAQIQKDLSVAQRSRGTLQSRLHDVSDNLQRSNLQAAIDKKRLDELASEKVALARRLRDRDEELRGKAKLLEVGVAISGLRRAKK
ncbi:MAG: hypothetical protein Q9205_000818 [Flavoplaca limonia]